VNALADPRVADYLNENFICTYLKVGTFQIIGGQKVGGNVATYFCLPDSCVVHAVAGKVEANKLLSEARWAYEVRKSALTFGANLNTGKMDMRRYADRVRQSHTERYQNETNGMWNAGGKMTLPNTMPKNNVTQQAQVHWLLAKNTLPPLENVYPTVWRQVLNEQLSTLPVAQR